jgi:glycosyltransferase involved in cell wall biosynthesis
VRLAFVVHDYHRSGGHSRYVTELVERFCRAHEVHVFSNTFDVPLPRGAVAHRVPAVRTTALSTILSFVPFAARQVARERFDVVHAQGFVLPRADVVTVHISNERWLTERRRQDPGAIGWRDRVFASIVVPLERRMYTRPDTVVIAISRALAADLRSLYGVRDPIAVVHHGVDPTQFSPAAAARHRPETRRALGLGEGDVAFLYVGDLRKGAVHAIRALAAVPGRLVLVSRTDPAPFLQEAAAVGVFDRVTAVPPTDEVQRYYGAADAFVLPTPYDAFGMVVTEAMACGLPVITTRAAGAAEILEDDATGLLVDAPVRDAELAAAMGRVAGDATLRARLGGAAAAAMLDHSWDRVAARTMDVYRRVLEGRRAA